VINAALKKVLILLDQVIDGEWTETSTRQNEIELAMFGE
jgi:hypothetical protein